jgi:fructose-1,6-bisphosphatase-3
MDKLHHSFRISEKLHKHIRTLLSHGCMYTVTNSNLLFHASIPLCDDGSLKEVEIFPGNRYSGKALMHNIGMMIRAAFESGVDKELQVFPRDYARDYFLYLWCGKDSPLFDKSKMATFERYFLKDKDTYK